MVICFIWLKYFVERAYPLYLYSNFTFDCTRFTKSGGSYNHLWTYRVISCLVWNWSSLGLDKRHQSFKCCSLTVHKSFEKIVILESKRFFEHPSGCFDPGVVMNHIANERFSHLDHPIPVLPSVRLVTHLSITLLDQMPVTLRNVNIPLSTVPSRSKALRRYCKPHRVIKDADRTSFFLLAHVRLNSRTWTLLLE